MSKRTLRMFVDAIFDRAAQRSIPQLTDEQVEDVRGRLADVDAVTITPAELRKRLPSV